MSNIHLGDLITLIVEELASSFELTVKPADLFRLQAQNAADLTPPEEIVNLHVSDLELDLPAHLQLQVDPLSSTKRLLVTLPSTLETSLGTQLGRIRIIITPEPLSSFEELM